MKKGTLSKRKLHCSRSRIVPKLMEYILEGWYHSTIIDFGRYNFSSMTDRTFNQLKMVRSTLSGLMRSSKVSNPSNGSILDLFRFRRSKSYFGSKHGSLQNITNVAKRIFRSSKDSRHGTL